MDNFEPEDPRPIVLKQNFNNTRPHRRKETLSWLHILLLWILGLNIVVWLTVLNYPI